MSCLPRIDSHIERSRPSLRSFSEHCRTPKKATSNHPPPRQPDAAVQPQEAHWLRPGQWVERSAAPFSRSKTGKKKKTPQVQGKPVCSKTSVDGGGKWRSRGTHLTVAIVVILASLSQWNGPVFSHKTQRWETLVTLYEKNTSIFKWRP